MKTTIRTFLLSSAILMGAIAVSVNGDEIVLESGEFRLEYDQFNRAWMSVTIDPQVDGTDWAEFYVDSSLDALMSNGQLLSDAFLSNFVGHFSGYFHMKPSDGLARLNPGIGSTEIDDAALEAALRANAANLDDFRLELIETPVSGVENIPFTAGPEESTFWVLDFGSGFNPYIEWDWDGDESFIEADSTYRFKITVGRCRPGAVNAGNGFVTNVLFVNGSSGGSDQTVEASEGDLINVTMLKPPAGGNGKFVLHGNAGNPSADTAVGMPFDLGTSCFPFLLSEGASPVIVANNIGKADLVGATQYYGVPAGDPDRATTSFLYPDLPVGTVLTFQGIIIDPSSPSTKGASVTNAVVLNVQ